MKIYFHFLSQPDGPVNAGAYQWYWFIEYCINQTLQRTLIPVQCIEAIPLPSPSPRDLNFTLFAPIKYKYNITLIDTYTLQCE